MKSTSSCIQNLSSTPIEMEQSMMLPYSLETAIQVPQNLMSNI
jgi:hypothetical protein